MPTIRKLKSARFKSHMVQDGKQVEVEVTWESTGGGALTLHFDGDEFDVTPNQVSLPANNAGTKTFTVTVKKKKTSKHCDVNFVFGNDKQDSVEVT